MFAACAVAVAVALTGQGSAPLRVVGNELMANGKQLRFHGLNVCGMEWNGRGENATRSVPIAYDQWKANIVRLPLSQDRWFGKTDDSPNGGAPYRNMVDEVVQEASSRGKYVLLDLHWSDGNSWGHNIGQHTMPDENSLSFWKDCAARYKNVPAVLFDLYNEPIETSWAIWRNGGAVSEQFQGKSLSYHAIGLQTLVDSIRGVGAKNVIVAGGLGYASRLDFGDEFLLKDPNGQGIVYANHFYPGWENIASWERRIVAFRARRLPLIVGEFGAEPGQEPAQEAANRVTRVLKKLREHDLHWIAWSFHPQARPCVISNWNYTPTPYFGVFVKAALEGREIPIAARPKTGPDITVFEEKLGEGWQHWGNALVDFGSTAAAHSGKRSIRVELADGQRFQLGHVPFDGNAYGSISLWLNGGSSGGQNLVLQAALMDAPQTEVKLPQLRANEWIQCVVSFPRLRIEGKEDVKSFTLRCPNGAASAFFVDDVAIRGN